MGSAMKMDPSKTPSDLTPEEAQVLLKWVARQAGGVLQNETAQAPTSIDEIGKQIRRRRIEQDLTKPELAHLAGVSVGPVNALERGLLTPSLENTRKILRALGLDLWIR